MRASSAKASTSWVPSWRRAPRRRARPAACATPKASGASASPGSPARRFATALLDRLPLAHGAQREDGDDRDADGTDQRADEPADALACAAVTGALEVRDRVADQATAHAADDDGEEREHARPGGGKRGVDAGAGSRWRFRRGHAR